ncbi:MAG TPA: class E sortase [Pedococcus sp.]|nr:class E sortase [Pedococcus sp.]
MPVYGVPVDRVPADDVGAAVHGAEDDGADDADDGADDDAAPVRAPGDRWRLVARSLGELLVTVGVVLLLFVVYELWVTDLLNAQAQSKLDQSLHHQWSSSAPLAPGTTDHGPFAVGQAFAILHIPRLGADYHRVIVEGTDQDQLAQGPGHYLGTAFPGEKGNVSLAGHRVGRGSPFLELDKLRPGDPIVIETRTSWFVYRVLGDAASGNFGTDASGIPGQQIVLPTNLSVISPTPDAPASAAPSGSYLTLTTCHPRFSARQRLVIHAKLEGSGTSKADQPHGPPELHGS